MLAKLALAELAAVAAAAVAAGLFGRIRSKKWPQLNAADLPRPCHHSFKTRAIKSGERERERERVKISQFSKTCDSCKKIRCYLLAHRAEIYIDQK